MAESDDDKDLFDELHDEDDEDQNMGDFCVRDRLPAPVALQYTTHELHQLIHQGIIDLTPPYQREIVWPETKQSRLIDSIYRNYYVPPVVFAQVYEDGHLVFRCVDGKQRLTSIQKFFDGQIPFKEPKSGKSYWYTMPDNARNKTEVPEYWKEDFAAKRITCIKYEDLSSTLERDIFQRVQLGMPLSAAEKLQAIASPWSEWISDLGRQMLTSDGGLQSKIDVEFGRGRDFQVLASLVYCCESIPTRSLANSTKLEAFLSRTDSPRPEFKKSIQAVLTSFWHIANKPELNAAFRNVKQRVAPVEFVFIGVLLYMLRECTEKQRAHAVAEMRRTVRETFRDIRLREDIQKFLWEFISQQSDKFDTGFYLDEVVAPAKRKTKKRTENHDEDEAEYAPSKRPKGRPRKS